MDALASLLGLFAWFAVHLASPGVWFEPGVDAAPLVLALLGLNAVFSLLFSLLIVRLLPAKLRRRPIRNALAIAAMGALLPLLGPMLLLVIGIVFPWLEKGRSPLRPEHLSKADFAEEVRPHSARFGAGGAWARLQGRDGVEGTRALLAIEHRRSALSTHLLTQSLSHEDETVRLLAYNLLERRERAIVAQLSALESRLDALPDAKRWLAMEAAALHLEFIYLEPVQGSLRQTHIEAAKRLLEDAGPPDVSMPWYPRWRLLRGRVEWLAGDADAAAREFEQALTAGCAPVRALPWLLEQAWQARDYAAFERLLKAHPVHPMIPLIGPVVSLWRKQAGV